MRQYLISIILFLWPMMAIAQVTDKSVGILIGNPVAYSMKFMKSPTTAIDGAAGVSIGRKTELSIHSDYLFFVSEELFIQDFGPLDFYYGIGGRMEFSDTIQLGPRLPFGLQYQMEEKHAEFIAELAPIVDLLGTFGVEISFLLGARYHF